MWCGEVVAENNQGLMTVNGHSHAERTSDNTFAILVVRAAMPFKDPIND